MNDNPTPTPEPDGPEVAARPQPEAAPAEPSPEERIAELEDRYRRALAELENLRRLKERDVDEARKLGITRFARDLLDVGDNLARALQAVPPASAQRDEVLANLLTGVEMTQRSLLAVLERHQVRPVRPEPGERFDPARHQAMFEVPTDTHPPGSVAEVIQPGYVIADRLLRPALVGVAKAVHAEPAPSGAEDG